MTYAELLLKNNDYALEIEAIKKEELLKAYRGALEDVDAAYIKFQANLSEYNLVEANKYNRFGKLKDEIKKQISLLEKTASKITESSQREIFDQGYFGMQWATEQALGKSLSFGLLDPKVIENAVFNEFSGAVFTRTIKNNLNKSLEQIYSTLTRSLAAGIGYKKTARQLVLRQLKDVFNGGYSDAVRVLRTEGKKAYSLANLEATYKARAMGINIKRRWVSARDGRTRDQHIKLDGQLEDKEGYFHMDGVKYLAPGISNGDASTVVNCRCVTIDELVDEDGKINEWVPYDKWKKS